MPRRPNDTASTNLHLRIPLEDYDRLHEEATQRMVSVNAICIRAIEHYLNQLTRMDPLP